MWHRAGNTIDGAADPPFTVVNSQTAAMQNGSFTPMAEIAIGPSTAASGIFAQLSSVELHTLMAVVSLVTANGRIRPTAHQVAAVLGISPLLAHIRLARLTRQHWRKKPLLVKITDAEYLATYVPSADLVAQRLAPPEMLKPEPNTVIQSAGRDRIVAASRKAYGRKREDVERELAQAHGWPLREEAEAYALYGTEAEPKLSGDDLHARQRLVRHGVEFKAADSLVRRFGRDRVARQIAYLPFRQAKSPTKILVSSIEYDYDAPPLLRQENEQT